MAVFDLYIFLNKSSAVSMTPSKAINGPEKWEREYKKDSNEHPHRKMFLICVNF